ncbi:MAG: hypothetical protein JSU90_01720 [Nitrospiraceae bacterium]|nr:MAG: hypothetical protein JSU90_01720 [Nitrospiraceae bacterium]
MKNKINTLFYYICYVPTIVVSLLFLHAVMTVSVMLSGRISLHPSLRRRALPAQAFDTASYDHLYWIEMPEEGHAAGESIAVPAVRCEAYVAGRGDTRPVPQPLQHA